MRKLMAIALAMVAGIASAQAQTYPSRSITLIVPFPPGGSTDVAARIMADRMRPILGQPIIIENVGGAGGSIAVGRLARAAPDGYTIDIGQWDTHVGSIIYPLSYDLQKDFAPIGLLSVNPQLMVAKKALPAHDLKGLSLDKRTPQAIRQQNAAGRCPAFCCVLPAQGPSPPAPAPHDLISGQVDLRGPGRGRAAAGAGRNDQGNREPVPEPLRIDARHSDVGRGRCARTLHVGLVRVFCAEGHAEGHHRQTQQRDGAGAGRSSRAQPFRRAWTRCGFTRAAGARGAGCVSEGRDREVVADHQGGQHQAGMNPPIGQLTVGHGCTIARAFGSCAIRIEID